MSFLILIMSLYIQIAIVYVVIDYYFFIFHRHMADRSPSPPQSPKHANPIRKATRLKDLAKRRANGRKTFVDIDVRTSIAGGPNSKIFQSYLGVLVREHISILVPYWEDVPEMQKNLLWQDILVIFLPIISCCSY